MNQLFHSVNTGKIPRSIAVYKSNVHIAPMKIKASMLFYIEDPESEKVVSISLEKKTRCLKVSRELHLYIAMIIGRTSLRQVYRPIIGEKM